MSILWDAYDDSALVGVEQNIPVLKGETASPDGNADPRLEEAIQAVVELGQASTSSLQRYLIRALSAPLSFL